MQSPRVLVRSGRHFRNSPIQFEVDLGQSFAHATNITGRRGLGDREHFTFQQYRLDMPHTGSAELADIFSFEGERAIGEATRYQISFTHPQADLSRSDYLNKPAALVIQPPFNPATMLKPEPDRRIQGIVTGFSLRSSSGDQTTYEVVLESRLALLRNAPKCRFFLEQSFPDIIELILREHGFDRLRASFEFSLYRIYRKRSFVMQWGEDDLSFITRLCRRSGIWFVSEEVSTARTCGLATTLHTFAATRR